MTSFASFCRTAAVALSVLAWAQAQPVGGPSGGRPATAQVSLTVEGAFTGNTAFEARGVPAGGISVTQFGAKLSVPLPPWNRQWFPSVGLNYRHAELDRDANTPLPDHLKSLGASLRVFGSPAPDWTFFGSISPSVSNAGSGFTSRGLGLGVIAVASRKFPGDFSGGLGFVYDSLARGTGRVIPVATFDWKPAPGWRAFLGYPRSGASWQATDALLAEFVAEADFGSFYVTADPGRAGPNRPALDRTRLEYQAVRVGPALTWRAAPGFSARLAAGAVPVLNAEYRKRNYKLKSEDTAAFASLELDWKF